MSKYKDSLSGGGGFPAGSPYTGGGQSGGAPAFKPPPPQPNVPGAEPDDGANRFYGPGSIDFSLMAPQESLKEAGDTTQDMFTGLKAFIFGADVPDAEGNHGGLPVLGWGPVGAAGRFASEVAANTVGAAVAGVAGSAIGALERTGGSPELDRQLAEQFAALPDGPAKEAAQAKIEADTGIFGTDHFTAHAHYMAEAIQRYEQEEMVSENPSLWDGAFRPAASYMDTITNMFGALGSTVKPVAEAWAGVGTPGQAGMNRVQMIMAVGDGHAVFNEDEGIFGTGILEGDPTKGLNYIEQVVYDKVSSGAWDHDDARTYLAAHGAAFSHAAAANIAGEIAFDPLNLATLGAGTIAKVGATGLKLLTHLDDAQALLRVARAAEVAGEAGAAEKVIEAEKAVAALSKGIRTGARAEAVGSRNLVGRLAKSETVGDAFRVAGRGYRSLEGTEFGKYAKVARTVIDPLHTVGANPRAAAALDEGSREVTRAVAAAHGELHHVDATNMLRGIEGAGEDITRAYLHGLAIYSGNVFRRVAGREFRASQMLMADKGEKLIQTLPFESLRAALGGMKRNATAKLTEEAGQFVRKSWDEVAERDLAKRMATHFGGRTEDEFLDIVRAMNGEQKSLMHASTYGYAIRQLHEAIAATKAAGGRGVASWEDGKLDRIVLMNRNTLTDIGADGIMRRLDEAADIDSKMAVIEEARATYPHLRAYVVDNTSDAATIDNFVDMMERIQPRLPAQISNAERAAMDPDLAAFDALITPSADPLQSTFTIAIRPKDEVLWGLERDSDGVLREVMDPWMDQTSDVMGAYMPVREVPVNIAGQPILGAAAVKGARLLDRSEAMGRMAMQGVTGKMVTQAARMKFTEKVSAKYLNEDGTPALTEVQVGRIWKALVEKVEDSDNISGVRGLSEGAIWRAVTKAGVIPKYAERAGMDSRSLLVDILDAYDGDIRTIGLTQKLSGRVKLMMGQTFMGNTAGVIAEHVWPLLKFKYNPFFQLQEKIEPWVLNAQRGANFALGTKPTDADRLAMDLYTNFAEKNLIHIADNDIAELRGRFTLGRNLMASMRGSQNRTMSGWAKRLDGMTDIQGTKQLNMMRTWKKGLGAQMRAEWEKTHPGEFDLMMRHHIATTGEVIDADDFAVYMAHSNLNANRLYTEVVDGVPHFNFSNAIKEAQWSAPQDLGELRPLDLNYMAARIGLTDSAGNELMTSMDLRRALADGRITHEDIARELRALGAHRDYTARVEAALRFSWPEFWSEAKSVFMLTDEQLKSLQDFFGRLARNRDMTPTEYMSQVYSPYIGRGTEAAVGSLGDLIATQTGRLAPVADLAQLRGIAGQSTVRDLYRQIGAVMTHHLDPSTKRALLTTLFDNFSPTDPSVSDILDAWDSMGATEALMDRILNFVHGTPGSGAHTAVADEATGLTAVRDVARRLQGDAGRPPHLERVIYDDDPDLAIRIADGYAGMEEGTHVATKAELAERATPEEMLARSRPGARQNARPGFGTLSRNVQKMYEVQAKEAQRLYATIVKPVSEGGLGIKVTPVRSQTPYATADALRADLARGRLKVPRDNYWHPYLDVTDAAILRAVTDVFGYGQEAVPFGSQHALMSTVAMFSDEARPTLMTDLFGAASWERFSNEVIPQVEQVPTTVAGYEARFGRGLPEMAEAPYVSGAQSRSVLSGVRAAAPEVQEELLGTVSYLRNHTPDVPFGSINIKYIPPTFEGNIGAVTLAYPEEVPSVVVNKVSGWQNDAVERANARAARAAIQDAEVRAYDEGTGEAPWLVGDTPIDDVYHEHGHVVDSWLHLQWARAHPNQLSAPGVYLDMDLTDFMDVWRTDFAPFVSKYGATRNNDPVMDFSETFGELWNLAYNPAHQERLAKWAAETAVDDMGDVISEGPAIAAAVDEFRAHMKRLRIWRENPRPVTPNPYAGQTVEQANAAGAGIRAPRRVGPMPQDLADELGAKFLGNGRFHETNPDVARAAAYMRNEMQGAVEHVADQGTRSAFAHVFDEMSGMPVTDAVPFNVTEAALWHGQTQMMATKFQDAFRLQYFAQNRSMLQRSVNHPMFGLYPASYMWGKVGPEMVKFMALEPFGAKTGAMLYTLLDIQKAVAVQRQFDPEFDAKIEELGHSAALSWLGYMLPATPWSVPASYPSWMRDMANQGLTNIERAESGKAVNDTDFISPLNSAVKKVLPLTTQLPFFSRALDEVNSGLPWNAEPEAATPVQSPTAGLPAAEALAPVTQSTPPGSPQSDPLSEPTTALDTEDILRQAMDNLSALLGAP